MEPTTNARVAWLSIIGGGNSDLAVAFGYRRISISQALFVNKKCLHDCGHPLRAERILHPSTALLNGRLPGGVKAGAAVKAPHWATPQNGCEVKTGRLVRVRILAVMIS